MGLALYRYSFLQSTTTAVLVLFFLVACENRVAEVRQFSTEERIPIEVQENLELVYTDSTYLRMSLEAPLAESYPQMDSPQREFRRGIKVRFFNNFGEEDSRLRADYALQLVNKDLWEARGDVVVVNTKGEQLNTEKLFWDSSKEIIYSDVFVKITTPTEIITGVGFEADQNFSSYEISQVSGIINIEDDA